MSFDPSKHMMRLSGKNYLPAASRLVWFREVNPTWSIFTEAVELSIEKGYAFFKATISDDKGNIIATAHKYEDRKGFGDFAEKSETGAVSRALSMCGFGTANEATFDEGTKPDGRGGRQVTVSDSPQQPKAPQRPVQRQETGVGPSFSAVIPQTTPEQHEEKMTEEQRLNLAGSAWVKEAERLGWQMRDEAGVLDKKLKASLTSDLHVFMEEEKPSVYTPEVYERMTAALPDYHQSRMDDRVTS